MKSMYRAIVESGDEADAPERVHVDHRGDRAVVTLDESDRLNVLSAPLVRQLRRALVALDADADVRTVVLTGADPGFSAGGDLKMMKVAVESLGEPEEVADVWRWIRREFGGLGLIPEVGTSWALTRRLGYQGALAYYLRGDHIDADTALRLGLVQEVVEHYGLLAAADEWSSRIASLPPHAVAMTKPLLRATADADWNAAITLEEFAEPTCFTTAAFADGVRAMLE